MNLKQILFSRTIIHEELSLRAIQQKLLKDQPIKIHDLKIFIK